jgi:hypothetical protein
MAPVYRRARRVSTALATAALAGADVLGQAAKDLAVADLQGYQENLKRMATFLSARQANAERVVTAVREALGFGP